MNEKFNELLRWFEENRFENSGIWNRSANLVFEFEEWVEDKDPEELAEMIGLDYEDGALMTAEEVKNKLLEGCDKWINQNIKALA